MLAASGSGQWSYEFVRVHGTSTGAVCHEFDLSTFFVGCSYANHVGLVDVCERA